MLRLVKVRRKQVDARLRELGITKLGRRMAVINAILNRQHASLLTGTRANCNRDEDSQALAPTIPVGQAQQATCGAAQLQVLFVAHSGYFAGNTYGGATRASLAMLRDVQRFCGDGLHIACLAQRPMPESMVYKL